jgi:lipoprotein-anchoring transpeptidase ErfK/SrfK
MNREQSSLPSDSTPRKLSNWLIILAATLVVVFALVFARFAFFAGNGTTEGPQGATTLANASPFATATPITSSTNGSGNGTVVPGVTPIMTPVIPGYPAPNVISAQEQQILQQVPSIYGQQESKIILVSLDGQYLQAIQNGKLILWTYVITGRANLSTPPGDYSIFLKSSPLTFLPASTDPKSPYFGYPSKVQYGMEFLAGGFYIHDTWWHSIYGPGLTFDHYDPGRLEWQEGSHGCVNTPEHAMTFLYQWADIGTPVIVF